MVANVMHHKVFSLLFSFLLSFDRPSLGAQMSYQYSIFKAIIIIITETIESNPLALSVGEKIQRTCCVLTFSNQKRGKREIDG